MAERMDLPPGEAVVFAGLQCISQDAGECPGHQIKPQEGRTKHTQKQAFCKLLPDELIYKWQVKLVKP